LALISNSNILSAVLGNTMYCFRQKPLSGGTALRLFSYQGNNLMKSKMIAVALLTSSTVFGYSASSIAESCYEASGSVTTENITPTLQIGNMSLALSDASGVVFSETGSLVGTITGSDGYFTTFLSHTARFPQGDSFVTSDDAAAPDFQYGGNPVRAVDGTGSACSYWIRENISDIAKGTRLFKNVTSVDVIAAGYISSCPGENKNTFDLSGTLCVE
jgi:hypothetical protein